MTTSSKSLSITQLVQQYGISQTSTWFFMQKVRKTMKSSKTHPLSELIHVDELPLAYKKKVNKAEVTILKRRKQL